MTLLRLYLSDDKLAGLQTRAEAQKIDLETAATRLLVEAAPTYPLTGRAVVVHGETLDRLEGILSGGSLLSAQDLQQKVERLAGISFLHLRLPFSPGQLEALAEKAERNGLTVEQLVERTAPRIYEQFFDLVERSR